MTATPTPVLSTMSSVRALRIVKPYRMSSVNGGPLTAGCGDIDPCTPYICQRPGTPSDEGYARIMLCVSITLKTAGMKNC